MNRQYSLRRKLVQILIIIFVIIFVLYWLYVFCVMVPSKNNIINSQALRQLSRAIETYSEDNYRYGGSETGFLPEDVISQEGEYLLSWRAALWKQYNTYPDKNTPQLNMSEPWYSQTNLRVPPGMFGFPYQYRHKLKMKTCVVMIKEIADEIRKYQSKPIETRKKVFNRLKGKAVVIILDPKYAVHWTEPVDISWKDLATGRVEPYKVRGSDRLMYIYCLRYEALLGVFRVKTVCPNSYKEWEELCGLSTQKAVD
jgi:hypothetical protein